MALLVNRKLCLLMAFFGVVLFVAAPAIAQEGGNVAGVADAANADDVTLDPNLYMGIQEAYQRSMRLRKPDVQPHELKTLFFTLWQHRLLQEAKRGYENPSGVTQTELNQDDTPAADRPRGLRELDLGGILFHATDNWTVWLNGQRITPGAIPKQVIEMRVRKDFVELKWYDAYTNLIYPIRLRPHQRFNLDSRIFLPGTSSL